ncbi:hypothetical protein RSAG8_00207, partial [Rhizoctonia solani AG-8 WAC10335]
MQALNYEDEDMEFEGSSPFNADDDDDEADTQSENSEQEEEPEPEPEPEPEAGDSGDESEQADESDQDHVSPPPSEHEHEQNSGSVFKKRQSPVIVPAITPARAASPATLRRAAFFTDILAPVRSYSIDPICAYPHPVATHSLAASKCMTHLLTGSDDGYIRDYDFFAGCIKMHDPSIDRLGRRLYPQHCGLGEGVMKGGVLRMWWENPSGEGGSQPSGGDVTPAPANVLEGGLPSPVYCMTLHSDALWGLSGTAAGNINLFTVRHDPGRVHFVLRGHKGPTSGLTLSADEKKVYSAGWDGHALVWSTPGSGVGRLEIPEKTPPWCVSACWSADGSQLYAGRRNGTVEAWDMRQTRNTHEGTPRLLRTLRNPLSSGAVSCVVAFPDGKHIACASQDNIRLWNVSVEAQAEAANRSRVAPFKIIAGHHGGTISQIRTFLMITASGNRGWFGESTRTVLVHEMKHIY